jgi:hypothetical protein
MPKLTLTTLVVLCLLFVGRNIAKGQTKIPLTEAIGKVEQEKKVRFFYLHDWIKDLFIDSESLNLPLPEFLNKALEGTSLTHTIYREKNIILFIKAGDQLPAESVSSTTEAEVFVADGKEYTIHGTIQEANTGETISGATVFVEETKAAAQTNAAGQYSLTLKSGMYTLKVSAVGKTTDTRKISLLKNQSLDFNLFDKVTELRSVEIQAEGADNNIASLEMSLVKLDVKTIKSMPSFLGEPDIIKSITLMPGVKTVGDGAGGFNVRGGNVDQNLVLLDDVPVFNTSHLFGFFSAFNSDVVKDVNLFKGGLPAQYGGRISSVLDVKLKNGNSRNFSIRGGAGIISSKLFAEGPIIKDRTSFIVGARYAYPNWILKKVPDLDIRRSSGMFYDLTARLHHRINENNSVSLSAYSSRDDFKLAGDTLYNWQTTNATAKWSTIIAQKVFVDVTALMSDYTYGIDGLNPGEGFESDFGINLKGGKIDVSYSINQQNKIEAGASLNLYDISPGKLKPDPEFMINPVHLPNDKASEAAVFIGDEFKVSSGITLYGGVRYSWYKALGPADVLIYSDNSSRSLSTIIDTLTFDDNATIKTYSGIEPRFSAKISLSPKSSVKASYNRNMQYLHLISNTTAVSPLDLWKASNFHIRPQVGQQFAVGYFRNLRANEIEISVEGYYKEINNMLEYKDGADLFLNPAVETQVVEAEGKNYGVEFLVRKNVGELTGWVGYTYSRSIRRVRGEHPDETINDGKWYPSNFDKPHDVSIVTNYKFNRRFSVSANFAYNTGRPITYPEEVYIIDGYTFVQFSERNQARIPDYHRLDISFTLDESLKQTKKWRGSWTLSFFNVYGRKNAYSVFFRPQYKGAQPQAFRLSVLGTIFPSLTYNFKIDP